MPDSKQLEQIRGMSAEEQEQTICKIEESAYEYEKLYGGCARATLRALQEYLGIGDGEAFRAATPFAAGTGRSGELCGALIGGIMAIGLVYAAEEFEDGEAESRPLALKSPPYQRAMEHTIKLCDRFREEFGSFRCLDIMKTVFGKAWNLRDDEARAEFLQPRIHDRCGEVTGKSARLAAEVILEKV